MRVYRVGCWVGALLAVITATSGAAAAERHDDPLLARAMADFPDDPRFARLAFDLARSVSEDEPEHLARLIEREYHGLRSDRSRYSYALAVYFRALAERIPRTHPAAAP